MPIVTLPFTLVPGTPENVSHVQSNFEAIRDTVNGNLDATNVRGITLPVGLWIVDQNGAERLHFTSGSHTHFRSPSNVFAFWRGDGTAQVASLDLIGFYHGGRYLMKGDTSVALRTVRGTVNAAGGVHAGEGFTVTKNATGSYTVNFSTAFSSAPSVKVSIIYEGTGSQLSHVLNGFPATGSFSVLTFNPTAYIDLAFCFTATGPA